MELRVLGPMEVVTGSRTLELGTRMHRALLSVLVMELDHVVSVDRIIDCLWGGRPPATAGSALHVYVSGLRKVFEPERSPGTPSQVLVTQPPGYVLRVPRHAVDAVRFEALVGNGQDLLKAGRPTAACEVLDMGLKLWRGPAYQGLEFESFLQSELARLAELRATAGEAHAEAMLARGHHAGAVVELDGLVAEDPLRERRWELLALALYRDGRQGEALRTLSRARQELAEALGLDLSPELCRLEHDILTHAPVLAWQPPTEQAFVQGRRVPLLHSVNIGAVLASTVVVGGGSRAIEDGPVLPADACPHGFCLADVAATVSSFTMNGGDPAAVPGIPFQVLGADDVNVELVGGGLLGTGERSFTVPAGTLYFVPLFILHDLPPEVGVFPRDASAAADYFFDPLVNGSRDCEIVVDGRSTPIGEDYVTGPAPVTGDESHHTVTLSAFLGALSPGTHTVVVRGGVFGQASAAAYGLAFMQQEFTYTVQVLPPEDDGA